MVHGSPARVRQRAYKKRTDGKRGGPTVPKSQHRLAAETWLNGHLFFRRHGFQIGRRTHPEYEDYCLYMWTNTALGRNYPSYEDRAFRKWLKNITSLARKSSKIVRPTRSFLTGKKRAYGTNHGCTKAETKKMAHYNTPAAIEARRLHSTEYNASDHGALIHLLYGDQQKEVRKQMCGEFVLQNGQLNQDYCGGLMNTEVNNLGGRSCTDYAVNVGGLYVWSSSQKTANGIKMESVRFLTDGQKEHDDNGRRHNAVLMWNREGHVFDDNTCPYNVRHDRGLEALTMTDCEDLGIKFFLLVDEDMTEEDMRKIEKMCQLEIHDLSLGFRLHRVPGAGKPVDLDNDEVKRRCVGVTYLPPNFFEDNPDICLVASAR